MRKPETTLHVVTMPPTPPQPETACAGTYTCECPRCEAERAKLVAIGVRQPRPFVRARRAA